jgi:hypothetical protein
LTVGLIGRERVISVLFGDDPRLDFWRKALEGLDF